MKTRAVVICALFSTLLVALVLLPATASTFPAAEMPPAQTACDTQLAHLTQDEAWFEQLVNPVLSTQAEVDSRLRLYQETSSCLSQNPALLASDTETVQTLLEYFLIFAGGAQTPVRGSALHLVSLETSNDPAVIRIREEAGIPAPPGYVFVRFYESREAMPPPVRAAFADENVAGVTIFTRYIAVLREEGDDVFQELLQAQTLPETVSHELIHAYVNANLGMRIFENIPDWYSEGIAIYFSGSGTNHVVVTPYYEIISTSPADYAQYDLNFDFLEAMLGREQLLSFIKRSIEAVDPALLIQAVSLADADELVARATTWKTLGEIGKAGLVVAGVVFLFWLVPRIVLGPRERAEKTPALPYARYEPTTTQPSPVNMVSSHQMPPVADWGQIRQQLTQVNVPIAIQVMRCPTCGQMSAPKTPTTTCPFCGAWQAPQRMMVCTKCGLGTIQTYSFLMGLRCPNCNSENSLEALVVCARCGFANKESAFSSSCPNCGYDGTGASGSTIVFMGPTGGSS